MGNVFDFVQQLQNVIAADSTTKCYYRALKYLNDNKYQTVRDIPEEDRETFLTLVKVAATE